GTESPVPLLPGAEGGHADRLGVHVDDAGADLADESRKPVQAVRRDAVEVRLGENHGAPARPLLRESLTEQNLRQPVGDLVERQPDDASPARHGASCAARESPSASGSDTPSHSAMVGAMSWVRTSPIVRPDATSFPQATNNACVDGSSLSPP